MFPTNTSYSCPGPSLTLSCTFPVGVTTVLWSSTGVPNILVDYPGHNIDRTSITNGVSYLNVESSSLKEASYRCIVQLANGVWNQSEVMISPPVAGKMLHYANMYIQDCVFVYREC